MQILHFYFVGQIFQLDRKITSDQVLTSSSDQNNACENVMVKIEDARTKRRSSHIGCKLKKWQKHYVLVYTLHTHTVSSSVSYTCFEKSVYYETYTDSRNLGPVAETDTNSIFKIL